MPGYVLYAVSNRRVKQERAAALFGSKLYGTVVRAEDPTLSDYISLQDVFHQSLSDDFTFRSSRFIAIVYFT
jgi:hypothetical protein